MNSKAAARLVRAILVESRRPHANRMAALSALAGADVLSFRESLSAPALKRGADLARQLRRGG